MVRSGRRKSGEKVIPPSCKVIDLKPFQKCRPALRPLRAGHIQGLMHRVANLDLVLGIYDQGSAHHLMRGTRES